MLSENPNVTLTAVEGCLNGTKIAYLSTFFPFSQKKKKKVPSSPSQWHFMINISKFHNMDHSINSQCDPNGLIPDHNPNPSMKKSIVKKMPFKCNGLADSWGPKIYWISLNKMVKLANVLRMRNPMQSRYFLWVIELLLVTKFMF